MRTNEMTSSLCAMDPDDLSRVTGGSILGNTGLAALFAPVFGPAPALVAASASAGYEYQKHGSDLSKWDWGVPPPPTSDQLQSGAKNVTQFLQDHMPKLNR